MIRDSYTLLSELYVAINNLDNTIDHLDNGMHLIKLNCDGIDIQNTIQQLREIKDNLYNEYKKYKDYVLY